MTYYILLPDDNPNDLNDANILGDLGTNNVFWPGMGLNALMNILEKNDKELIDKITIKKENNKSLTIEQFISEIKKFNIKQQ